MISRILFIGFFLTAFISLGQNIDVTGTVVEDSSNEPLPGVNVIIKNTNVGVTTDFDGNFNLGGVPINSVLVFSSLGYQENEFTVINDQAINIKLIVDMATLEEVVIVGYGTQTKKEITGAVSVISSETIEKLNPVRVESALQGQVAGVSVTSQSGSPGGASSIRIRGITTNGNNNPLILVDGNVVEDLSVINPNDIESINVLKDATAGIYGVRAANGVILITTKSGRKNSDLKFDFSTYTGIQETTRTIPVLNATEYGALINESHAVGGEDIPFVDFATYGKGTNWQDEIFQTAPISNVNFSAAGGGEKSSYSFGTSYLTQDGIVGGSDANFNRFTGRASYDIDWTEKLKMTTTVIYVNTNTKTLKENTLGSVLFNTLNMSPAMTVKDSNGDYTIAEGLGNEVINPVAQIENTYNDSKVNKISGVIGFNYSFSDHFKVDSKYQFNYAEVTGKTFFPEVFYGSGKVFNISRNVITENDDIYRDYTFDNYATYSNNFNDSHNVKVLLGMSVFQTTGDLSEYTGFDIPDNSYSQATIKNASDVVDNYQNGGNTFDGRLLSYFTRIQYDYKGKYLFSGVLRRDGSTRFGSANKFGYFPSGSIGWIVSDESFLEDSKTINFLKLRVSYGIVGNDRIPDYRFVSLLSGEGTYVFNDEISVGTAEGALANPEIKWEKQKTFDVGMDFKLFDRKVDITVDYFNKRTEDLLLTPQVSGILGVYAPGSSAPIVNAGTVDNSGLEFQIAYMHDISEDLRFNASYNFTTLENEVIYVASENGFVAGGEFGVGLEPPSRMEVGQPIGYFYGLKTLGVFQDQAAVENHPTQLNAAPGDLKYADINEDGIIDSNDRTYIGDPIPGVTMGFNLGVNFKNFDFTGYVFASIGNEIVRNYERNQSLTNRSVYFLDRWTGQGSTNENPRVTTGANSNLLFSDYYVEDGSYARIQNLQVGYTFSDKVIESLRLDKFRLYASVNNVYTFSDYKGYDPSASSGNPIGGGIDQGFYPVPRIYMLGLNIKF
jgi:TonB-linked SusC/RagA family outer membrane protein